MKRSDFLNMLEGRVPVSRGVLGELRELLGVFPYFQSAHLLLLKGLHDNADVKFESQLKISAFYVSDREVLYHLITGSLIKPPAEIPVTIKTPDSYSDNIPEGETDSHIYRGPDELFVTETGNDNEPELQDVIFLSDEDFTEDVEPGYLSDYTGNGDTEGSLLELESPEEDSEITFTSDVIDQPSEYEPVTESGPSQAELIDRFIEANPRIEPSREKNDLPVEDISKPFTEGGGWTVTETLARIYTTQGYYSKALDIYQKLALKYPEKSSYFATQIEKVEELLKK